MMWLHFFELLGTVAFAISGALMGIQKRMDLFGILMLSVTTAVGGGIMRDVLIGNHPPLTFRDPVLISLSIVSALLVLVGHHKITQLSYLIQVFDAIGLGVFTISGSTIAISQAYNSPFSVVCLGVITGIGGGVLRDMFAQEIPFVFRKEIYAVASITGALCYYYSRQVTDELTSFYLGSLIIVILRLICIRFNIHLPVIDPERANKKDQKL